MLQPLADRIVVKQADAEEVSPGGIVIPTGAQEKPLEGEVKAVGPGRWLDNGKRIEPSVKVGDKVLFTKFSGTELEIEGEAHLIIREGDILGIVTPVEG
jgi:chaperonin GroES